MPFAGPETALASMISVGCEESFVPGNIARPGGS